MQAAAQVDRNSPLDILRLEHCPMCGYNLDGLPRRHRCPECGYEYDECTFILEFHKDAEPQRASRWLQYGVVGVLFASLFVFILLRAPGRLRPAVLAVAAGLIAMPIIAILARSPRAQRVRPHWRVVFASDGLSMPADSLALVEIVMSLEDHSRAPSDAIRLRSSGNCLLAWSSFRQAAVEHGGGNWNRLSLRYAHSRDAELNLGWFESSPEQAARLEQELNRRILAMRA